MHLNSMVALNRPFHNFTDEDAVVDGKKVYIMRPCLIHGPGNKGNLNLLYGVVSKGIPWQLGAFENRRFVHEHWKPAGGDQGLTDQGCPQRHLSHG